jgi:hypothetical protein
MAWATKSTYMYGSEFTPPPPENVTLTNMAESA